MDAFIPPEIPSDQGSARERDSAGCPPPGIRQDAYDLLLARLRREYVPYSVLWELTHHCNLNCVMCYNERLPIPELASDECCEILKQLAGAGTLHLTLTGGEILTRPDFFAIAEEARRLGFSLQLKTNGTLISDAIAERIARLSPLQVDISLLGARAETFDAISGEGRTLERVLAGVGLLQKQGVRVKLNTLLMDLNLSEQRGMIDLAAKLGVYYEQVLKVSPSDSGSAKAVCRQLSRGRMAEALAVDGTPCVPGERSEQSRTCSVGLSSCLISPYGLVYPCVELRIPAGDLRRERFGDIWRAGAILNELRECHIRGNLTDCRACSIQAYCQGRCAGIAWKERGDPYGGHVTACWQAQARYAQQHPGATVPTTPVLARTSPAPSRAIGTEMSCVPAVTGGGPVTDPAV